MKQYYFSFLKQFFYLFSDVVCNYWPFPVQHDQETVRFYLPWNMKRNVHWLFSKKYCGYIDSEIAVSFLESHEMCKIKPKCCPGKPSKHTLGPCLHLIFILTIFCSQTSCICTLAISMNSSCKNVKVFEDICDDQKGTNIHFSWKNKQYYLITCPMHQQQIWYKYSQILINFQLFKFFKFFDNNLTNIFLWV